MNAKFSGASRNPDLAAHNSFDAIINLTVHHAVIDSEGMD
jgi:hypothetical protein